MRHVLTKMLDILQDEVMTKELELECHNVEAACLVLHPRCKMCYAALCRNRGAVFQSDVRCVLKDDSRGMILRRRMHLHLRRHQHPQRRSFEGRTDESR